MSHRMNHRALIRPPAIFFLAAAALNLAAATLLAQSETGDYTQRNLGSLAQPALPAPTDNAKYSVGSYPLYWPELEPGEGKDIATGYCNACHGPRYIPMQPPLTQKQWADEVTKMVKVFGIDIPETDQALITKYLTEHYSTETRKK